MKKKKGYEYAKYTKSDGESPALYYIYSQLYEINYYLIIGQEKKTRNYFPQLEDHKFGDGLVFSSTKSKIVIWVNEKGNLDTFAHELVHVISRTFDQRGIQFDTENDEPAAYLMSWLFRSFYFAVK